ncbi:MAG: hypothetical protein FRX48_07442 [Lasallia pustulata]|uniref:Transcription factor Rba50 n=1 Tax=Lasallia pustulata TaxID=136370 RepID=A0A5M8PJE6_9LECA|nr:MAG: hypothetical protein FRX48_07442 [Lasallia pustulata]
MALRGQRFHLDLSSDEDGDEHETGTNRLRTPAPALHLAYVGDIKERPPSSNTKPPSAPRPSNSTTGFPAHRKRPGSAQRRGKGSASTSQLHDGRTPQEPQAIASGRAGARRNDQVLGGEPLVEVGSSCEDAERKRIDEENRKRMAEMSPDEIARERQELLAGLSPSLIERLLRKANIDEGRTDVGTEPSLLDTDEPTEPMKNPASTKKVTFKSPPEDVGLGGVPPNMPNKSTSDPNAAPLVPPPNLQPASSLAALPPAPTIHFPHPPQPPPLDPSDPDFLSNLHSKYFPAFPIDPSKLAWMAPLPTPDSTADLSSPYHPAQPSLAASSIRFSFRGDLLPPNLSRQIPSNTGLHHHSDAPEAAGYTIPELAHLSRSAFPAQRCVAYQTLGRILYRLGIGTFGDEEEELAQGLWKCVEEGRVLDTLVTEAGRGEGEGNRSCRITAMEAVWLWRKGGGKRVKAT